MTANKKAALDAAFLLTWKTDLFEFRFADATCAIEAFFPVTDIHAFDTYYAAGGWRVDEFVIAEIDADVGEAAFQRVVENQIAGFQVRLVHTFAGMAEFLGGARQVLAPGFPENQLDQSAAIETCFRRIAAVLVMDAEHSHRAHRQFRCMIGQVVQAGDGFFWFLGRRIRTPCRTGRHQADRKYGGKRQLTEAWNVLRNCHRMRFSFIKPGRMYVNLEVLSKFIHRRYAVSILKR